MAQQLLEKSAELESLQKQLGEVKENNSAELEQVILNYEEKLDARANNDETLELETKIQTLTETNADLESKLISLESKLEACNERISLLEIKKSNLQAQIVGHEEETAAYQSELEQVLANQEEELDRNEQLQQQLEYASSRIEDLKVGRLPYYF